MNELMMSYSTGWFGLVESVCNSVWAKLWFGLTDLKKLRFDPSLVQGGWSTIDYRISAKFWNHLVITSENSQRYISTKMYFVYILVDSSQVGRQAIVEFWNCIVGRRTIGCCTHVMTIIWYLSYARYQNNVNPPAQFLDTILIRNLDEEQ